MRAAAWAALLTGALGACRDRAADPIHIVAGSEPSERLTLLPRASLAEYIEIGPTESALLLTLSSTERNCDSGADAAADDVTLSVRVRLPGAAKLAPGSYPSLPDAQSEGRAHARPTLKLRGRRFELQPGGELELRELELLPRGSVSGLLKFEFPGDAQHSATRVSGRFEAHFCRISKLRE